MCIHADGAHSPDWLSECVCQLILRSLNPQTQQDQEVVDFVRVHRKKLYKGGRKSEPNFCIGENSHHETVLCRLMRSKNRIEAREVVTTARAHQIVESLHSSAPGVCNPGGINSIVGLFTCKYYYKGIRKVVEHVLRDCQGTCKLIKSIDTHPPPPKAIRTMRVMEEVQCDLITICSTRRGLPDAKGHRYKYMLSVKECFSKFCWLFPLESKQSFPIATILSNVFKHFGAPSFLHTDNGKEFISAVVKYVCNSFSVKMKQGRPYHPQSQGQIENLNKRIKACLSHFLLRYGQEERAEVWPSILGDVAWFLNNTWHHTIRNTPFCVFMGRSQMTIPCHSEMGQGFMEEDFLLDSVSDSDDDPFTFCTWKDYSERASSAHIPISSNPDPDYLLDFASLENGRMQIHQDAFEATEAMIQKNVRAHMKRVKLPEFRADDRVLLKNPNKTSLVSTLNVTGTVRRKVGRNIYEVAIEGTTGASQTVYASEMVPALSTIHKVVSPITVNEDVTSRSVLDAIRDLADNQRRELPLVKKYSEPPSSVPIDDLLGMLESLNITLPLLMTR